MTEINYGLQNIVLIGFAGCGKSTLGCRLAKQRNCSFVDIDKQIEISAGLSISEIFQIHGENYFRRLEAEEIQRISRFTHFVVATGGGCIKNPLNMEALKKSGIILYLESTPDQIYQNTLHEQNRPLLQTEDKMGSIRKLMEERLPLYRRYADITVNLTGLNLSEGLDAVITALEQVKNVKI